MIIYIQCYFFLFQARFLCIALLASAALAAPAPMGNEARAGRADGGGNQVFSYETVDDYGAATGYHYLNGEPGVNVDGGFGFTDEEGRNFDLTFVADENGYGRVYTF